MADDQADRPSEDPQVAAAAAPPATPINDADRISERYCQLYAQHKAECTARYFSAEQLAGRGTVWESEARTPAGPVRLCSAHPIATYLSVPKLPEELAAALEKKP